MSTDKTDTPRLSTEDVSALLEGATPGPWVVNDTGDVRAGRRCLRTGWKMRVDGDSLIMRAAPDLAADLLDARRELEAERARAVAAEARHREALDITAAYVRRLHAAEAALTPDPEPSTGGEP